MSKIWTIFAIENTFVNLILSRRTKNTEVGIHVNDSSILINIVASKFNSIENSCSSSLEYAKFHTNQQINGRKRESCELFIPSCYEIAYHWEKIKKEELTINKKSNKWLMSQENNWGGYREVTFDYPCTTMNKHNL